MTNRRDTSPSALRTECQTCGGWAEFTGRTTVMDGRTFAISYCHSCLVDIPFWKPDVELRIAAFERAVALHAIAKRLCSVATGSEQEIRAALAVPTTPPPLGANACLITTGVLSLASVELQFSEPMIALDDIDTVFGGEAKELPRTGPSAKYKLVYFVHVVGAPACVALFASFHEPPRPRSAVKNTLLRIDPAT